jgi:RNA polymerase sigma factor (TIGR02999 family)
MFAEALVSWDVGEMAGSDAVSGEAPGGEVTRHLRAWSAGDQRGAATAFSALHTTLRRLAGRALSRERADHTLGTGGLISEVFFRLSEQQRIEWRSREHFLGTAAQMMRRVLVDHARGRAAAKRNHGAPLLTLAEGVHVASDSLCEIVELHDALEALAAIDRSQSEIVELRFFGGMTHEEIASCLGISLATVERRWRLARARLYRYLQGTAA